MELAQGNRTKNGVKLKKSDSIGSGLNSNPLLIIKLPDTRALRIVSRSFFLALILLTLPSIGPFMNASSNATYNSNMDIGFATFRMLAVIFPDLFDEGLVRRGHLGLILCSGTDHMKKDSEFLSNNGIDAVVQSNLDVLADEQLPNYRIAYIRRFQNTMVVMRKESLKEGSFSSTEKSKLCGMRQEARKMALRGLEGPLLEQARGPRRALLRSINKPRKIKFLPDLVGDSLAAYRRRILFSDEKTGGLEEWFHENYPTRNQRFDMFNWDVEARGSQTSADWLRSNVREEDFVVMKAEARVEEEMMKDKTICLVDELFLECENQWEDEAEEQHSKRAYWQCLPCTEV